LEGTFKGHLVEPPVYGSYTALVFSACQWSLQPV